MWQCRTSHDATTVSVATFRQAGVVKAWTEHPEFTGVYNLSGNIHLETGKRAVKRHFNNFGSLFLWNEIVKKTQWPGIDVSGAAISQDAD